VTTASPPAVAMARPPSPPKNGLPSSSVPYAAFSVPRSAASALDSEVGKRSITPAVSASECNGLGDRDMVDTGKYTHFNLSNTSRVSTSKNCEWFYMNYSKHFLRAYGVHVHFIAEGVMALTAL